MKDVFKYALENKLRFPFKGNITTEDLFDLSLENLKKIYKTVNSAKKKLEEEDSNDGIFGVSSVNTKEYNDLSVAIEILKTIAMDKKESLEKSQKELENRKLKEKYLEILNRKENEELENLSKEELLERIKSL